MHIYYISQAGNPIYVGSSTRPGLSNHHYTYLGSMLQKHILEQCSPENRFAREQYWIDYFTAHGYALKNKQRAKQQAGAGKKQPTLKKTGAKRSTFRPHLSTEHPWLRGAPKGGECVRRTVNIYDEYLT